MPFYKKKGARSKKTMIDGILFDSLLESDTYLWLKEERDLGNIRDLKIQPKFDLLPKGKRTADNPMKGFSWNSATSYKADFSFINKKGELVVVDSKGFLRSNDPCKPRIRLFLHLYPDVIFMFVSRRRQNEPLLFHYYLRENGK